MMRDFFTNSVASAALVSPWWFESLEDVSSQAALWLPILGGVWLFVQIVSKMIDLYRIK